MNSVVVGTNCPGQLELGVAINRPAAAAYDFLSLPGNFPKWASGIGSALRQAGGDWVAETAEGPAMVRFSERNGRGVLDYSVTLPQGISVYVRLRIVAKARGCKLVVTVIYHKAALQPRA